MCIRDRYIVDHQLILRRKTSCAVGNAVKRQGDFPRLPIHKQGNRPAVPGKKYASGNGILLADSKPVSYTHLSVSSAITDDGVIG